MTAATGSTPPPLQAPWRAAVVWWAHLRSPTFGVVVRRLLQSWELTLCTRPRPDPTALLEAAVIDSRVLLLEWPHLREGLAALEGGEECSRAVIAGYDCLKALARAAGNHPSLDRLERLEEEAQHRGETGPGSVVGRVGGRPRAALLAMLAWELKLQGQRPAAIARALFPRAGLTSARRRVERALARARAWIGVERASRWGGYYSGWIIWAPDLRGVVHRADRVRAATLIRDAELYQRAVGNGEARAALAREYFPEVSHGASLDRVGRIIRKLHRAVERWRATTDPRGHAERCAQCRAAKTVEQFCTIGRHYVDAETVGPLDSWSAAYVGHLAAAEQRRARRGRTSARRRS